MKPKMNKKTKFHKTSTPIMKSRFENKLPSFKKLSTIKLKGNRKQPKNRVRLFVDEKEIACGSDLKTAGSFLQRSEEDSESDICKGSGSTKLVSSSLWKSTRQSTMRKAFHLSLRGKNSISEESKILSKSLRLDDIYTEREGEGGNLSASVCTLSVGKDNLFCENSLVKTGSPLKVYSIANHFRDTHAKCDLRAMKKSKSSVESIVSDAEESFSFKYKLDKNVTFRKKIITSKKASLSYSSRGNRFPLVDISNSLNFDDISMYNRKENKKNGSFRKSSVAREKGPQTILMKKTKSEKHFLSERYSMMLTTTSAHHESQNTIFETDQGICTTLQNRREMSALKERKFSGKLKTNKKAKCPLVKGDKMVKPEKLFLKNKGGNVSSTDQTLSEINENYFKNEFSVLYSRSPKELQQSENYVETNSLTHYTGQGMHKNSRLEDHVLATASNEKFVPEADPREEISEVKNEFKRLQSRITKSKNSNDKHKTDQRNLLPFAYLKDRSLLEDNSYPSTSIIIDSSETQARTHANASYLKFAPETEDRHIFNRTMDMEDKTMSQVPVKKYKPSRNLERESTNGPNETDVTNTSLAFVKGQSLLEDICPYSSKPTPLDSPDAGTKIRATVRNHKYVPWADNREKVTKDNSMKDTFKKPVESKKCKQLRIPVKKCIADQTETDRPRNSVTYVKGYLVATVSPPTITNRFENSEIEEIETRTIASEVDENVDLESANREKVTKVNSIQDQLKRPVARKKSMPSSILEKKHCDNQNEKDLQKNAFAYAKGRSILEETFSYPSTSTPLDSPVVETKTSPSLFRGLSPIQEDQSKVLSNTFSENEPSVIYTSRTYSKRHLSASTLTKEKLWLSIAEPTLTNLTVKTLSEEVDGNQESKDEEEDISLFETPPRLCDISVPGRKRNFKRTLHKRVADKMRDVRSMDKLIGQNLGWKDSLQNNKSMLIKERDKLDKLSGHFDEVSEWEFFVEKR